MAFLAVRHGVGAAILLAAAALAVERAAIVIDYPLEGSLFPPDFTPPTFLWRDSNADTWLIETGFGDDAPPIRVTTAGEPPGVGEIDERAISENNELPVQPAARAWRPEPELWAAIQDGAQGRAAAITITGLRNGRAVSRGRVRIRTAKDPVGAPIFYRDVPLMPSEVEKGVIKPLARAAIPLIAWRLRDVSRNESRLLLEGLYTCANCHSFSRDGKTLGMELDGRQNEKATYALAAVRPQMSIRNEDVITWKAVPRTPPAPKTTAFMPQLSPDGEYVVATVNEEIYVANFKDYRFLQVFYPTRGILAWYSRTTGRMAALAGADDPHYVHTNAVWTPDGKYLVFARAEAKDSYPKGRKLAEYANDPNEVPIQYDLYRIPFHEGRGGRAEPIAGASRNGKSNSFPKVSPDGKWIVFVQSRNGQLMRPDSELYIVPATGGKARRMRCNTPRMNSWHSFSPNGRWLVFSSKARSPYTQMYLTHLDEEGNDSPAILIENATAANRAVNIPEFVNVPPDGLQRIDVPAAEFYRLFDIAWERAENGDYDGAIAGLKNALEVSPGDAKAHNNLGIAYARKGMLDEAVAHWRNALESDPGYANAHNNLGIALAGQGRIEEAISHFRRALEASPESAEVEENLGVALLRQSDLDGAITHLRRAAELRPELARLRYILGRALTEKGRLEEAIRCFRQALEASPDYAEAHNSLGVALARQGRLEEAAAHWRKALESNPGYTEARENLGRVLAPK
jgi:Flp pilus assembly protein TadD